MSDYSSTGSPPSQDFFSHTSQRRSVPPPLPTSEEPTRRPRGRPPGSKNKPKQPVGVNRDDLPMKPVVLEIAAKSDILGMVTQFARRSHAAITILSATGSVSNVTLRHPGSHAPTLTLHGTFSILSLTGTFLGFPSVNSSGCFGISLAGSQGQVFGGIVAGKATAASTVVVVGTTFVIPRPYRLPGELEEADHHHQVGNCSSGGVSTSVYGGVAAPTPLNCRIPPDHVMTWGPTSRQSPLPPPY